METQQRVDVAKGMQTHHDSDVTHLDAVRLDVDDAGSAHQARVALVNNLQVMTDLEVIRLSLNRKIHY